MHFIASLQEPNNKLIFKIYEIDVSKDVMNLVRSKEINDNQAFIIPGII